MEHKGLSGARLEVSNSVVYKWARNDLAKDLALSYEKNLKDLKYSFMHPLKAVSVFGKVEREGYFQMTMPFMDLPSGFTFKKNRRAIKNLIRTSFEHRSLRTKFGFKNILSEYVKNMPDTDLKFIFFEKLKNCPDIYPHGFAHGDLGFANMLVAEESVYLIDYTPSFIESPLMDLVTMELSLFSPFTTPWHIECYTDCSNSLFIFREQADLLRMAKVLTWYSEAKSEERKIELRNMFYGFRRTPNI